MRRVRERQAPCAGLGSCPLVLGECVQGRADAQPFLITSPIDAFSWAEFMPDLALQEVRVTPPSRTKARRAVSRYLAVAGHHPGGRLALTTPLPPGLGFGTSTADITAAIRAAAAAWGETVSPSAIAAIAIDIEPADGSMFPGSVAFDHCGGELLERLGPLPPFHAVVVCGQGEVDTVSYDLYRKDFRYQEDDERQLRLAWDMVRHAVRRQNLSLLGSAATISARINEQLLPKPYFAAMHEFMEAIGLEGLMAGHSGTLLAFLLDPHAPGFLEQLGETRSFVDELCPARRLEIGNRELCRELDWSTVGGEDRPQSRTSQKSAGAMVPQAALASGLP